MAARTSSDSRESRAFVCKQGALERLIYPKPQRPLTFIRPAVNEAINPVTIPRSHVISLADGDVGHEILDILLCTSSMGLAISPGDGGLRAPITPVSCESPPIRAPNPLVCDAHFTKQRAQQVGFLQADHSHGVDAPMKPNRSSSRFVRIEGFVLPNSAAPQGILAFA